MPATLRYRSHAKVNLYLDVLNKRDDGYNNIETVFQTVDLADEMTFTRTDGGISMTCSHPSLETDDGNLMMKAARVLQEHTGTRLGATMHLEKRIPIAGGMAGGSGNGAAALVALDALWETGCGGEALAGLALQLGSDVPYCISGGTALATGRGEEIAALAPIPETWFVLVHPPIPISAGFVYTHPLLERSTETPSEVVGSLRVTPSLSKKLAALGRGDVPDVIFNRMEVPVFQAHPALAAIKERLLDAGCTAAAMSGSGATMFGVCPDRVAAKAVAEAIGEYPTTVVRSTSQGVTPV